MASIDEIDDAQISLGRVLAVQTASVSLQRPFLRHWHCQYQGIKPWVGETLANQLSGRQQHSRCING